MIENVYVVEHPDHVCTLHYLPSDREKEVMDQLRRDGILWFENLGTVDTSMYPDGEELLVTRCSRPMVFLNDRANEPDLFLPLDHAEKLLQTGSPDYSGTSHVEHGPRVFLRFGSDSTELVYTPYDHYDCRVQNSVTVPMYIQETMIRPICAVSVDPDDPAYAECDWRERLGSVQGNVIGKGSIDVRIDEVNRLVRNCSRPMLLVSECLPPTYVPREWLESAVAKFRLRSAG